jgi:DNA-binding transcriptional regulator YhcF (GntR family)
MTVLPLEEMTEERVLLSDRIRNTLTDEIASGAMPAGTALDEQQLADRFNASRTPVREALRQLSVSGLVEMRPRRGVIVTRLTAERIMEMFEAMAEIEALCVRLATYRMTPIERSRLLRCTRNPAHRFPFGTLRRPYSIRGPGHGWAATYEKTALGIMARQITRGRGAAPTDFLGEGADADFRKMPEYAGRDGLRPNLDHHIHARENAFTQGLD